MGTNLFPRDPAWRESADVPEVRIEEYRSWSRGSWDQASRNSREEPPPTASRPQHGNKQAEARGQQHNHGGRRKQHRQHQRRPVENMHRMVPVQPALGQQEMQRLMQPIMRPDGMQRMAMMMALLDLGTPQVYGCLTQTTRRW
jgi:hypothetical protein